MTGARLQGGPFDGDKGVMDGEVPPKLWVRLAQDCSCGSCTDWFDEPHAGSEVYRYDDEQSDGKSAVYVYTDENLSGGHDEDERVLIGAVTEGGTFDVTGTYRYAVTELH